MESCLKIISFDVGIKNLAYCIFDISGGKTDIIEWEVVDLLEENETNVPKHTCTQLLTSRKTATMCGKVAKYGEPIENSTQYFCERHAKMNARFLMPHKKFTQTSLKKLSVQGLRDLGKEYGYTFPEMKEVKTKLIENLRQYFDSRVWKPLGNEKKKVNAGHVDLITIGRQMHRIFSSKPIMRQVTHVLIENQITPIANRMKTVQGMLSQEFIMLECPHIEYISSFNKLKKLGKSMNEEPVKDKYKSHKKDGMNLCRTRLSQYPLKWLTWFESYKNKKDDLADAFLQGIWYIEEKLMKNTTNIKIKNVNSP